MVITRKIRALSILQLLLTSLCCASVHAETPSSPGVLVTATRINTEGPGARGNTTVITADDIAKSTAQTLPELLGRETGIVTRSLYGNNGTRSTVDMRGFGATSGQNTLVLLDGRRLNDVDFSSIDFSVIPLQSIERIEIMRNSGAVLYGDGAVGGSINIITRHPQEGGSTAFIKAGAGNLNTRLVDAHASHSSGPVSIFIGAHGINSDGYRDHNDLQQRSINSDIRYSGTNSELSLKLNGYNQELDLPGVRRFNPGTGVDEFRTNRNGTGTPRDYADQDGYVINPGYSYFTIGGSEVIFDFSYRHKNQQAFFDDYAFGGAFASYLDTDLDTWSVTPRVITPHHVLGMDALTTAGIDHYNSAYESDRSLNESTDKQPIHRLSIDQKSTAVYADTIAVLTPETTVNLGARLQWVKQRGRDSFDAGAPGAGGESRAPDYDKSDRLHMLEAGLERQFTPSTRGHIKWTRSARVSTVDELFEFDTLFARVFSPIDPQTANGIDIGAGFKDDRLSLKANTYYMRLKNEIHFDPTSFQNINLEPTKRYGVEIDAGYDVTEQLRLLGKYTYMRAKFRDGMFSGNNVPLVPKNTASLAAHWEQSTDTVFAVAVNYTDEKYFDNDQANNFGKQIPSYTTVDARASHMLADFRLGISVNNIFEKKAMDYGVSSAFTAGVYNGYPLPERTLLFTVSRALGGD